MAESPAVPGARSAVRGQAMVEFIYVMPVLLMLLLGALQFGLIYHAKTTLNYAAFETARAGAVNNARMWAMELAFARSLAPLYTTPYLEGDECTPPDSLEEIADHDGNADLDDVKCARARVRTMLDDGYARILLVNPREESFLGDHAVTVDGTTYIPNDNLMYRSAAPDPTSNQSIQDANLIKVHVGICYELVVPLVNRMIEKMAGLNRAAGSFGAACAPERPDRLNEGHHRFGIPIYAQAVMRMQSDPILDSFCAGFCG